MNLMKNFFKKTDQIKSVIFVQPVNDDDDEIDRFPRIFFLL